MKIWGKLTCRNEGYKAVNTMRYHLDILGWDGFVYIDNDSTDDSIQQVMGMKDSRVKILTTDGRGLDQMYWSSIAHKWLTQHTDCEAVVPVDCDMMWIGLTPETSIYAYDSQALGFMAHNYAFNADDNSIHCANDYHTKFWKYLTYRRVVPNCQKTVLFRKGFSDPDIILFEGDHFATYFNTMISLPLVSNVKVYEYPVLGYEDFIRKTVNSGIGRILSGKIQWVRMKDERGIYTARDLDQLSRTGELMDRCNNFILTISECNALKNKGGEEFVIDKSIINIDIPCVTSPLDIDKKL